MRIILKIYNFYTHFTLFCDFSYFLLSRQVGLFNLIIHNYIDSWSEPGMTILWIPVQARPPISRARNDDEL